VGFGSFSELAAAYDAGQTRFATWRKAPTQATTRAVWFDLSMSPGNPVPQYYASSPLVAKTLSRSTDIGLDHGPNVSPATKHLTRCMALTATATALPMPMRLADYLLYYPFVDEGTTDAQAMTNSATLPRYTDGRGVQIMAVSVASRIGGQTFQVTYTNQDGTAGRVTPVIKMNSVSVNGSIVSTALATAGLGGPFLPLQSGDSGVRSIESVQMISGTDVGLFTLVLVKPLAQMSLRGIDAPVEVEYARDFAQLPTIVDDAYLNLLACPIGSLAATTIHGTLEVAWN